MADAMELSKQVYDICASKGGPSTELRAFLNAHPQVNVTKYSDYNGKRTLHRASERGHASCVRMLLDHGADVHARDHFTWTALVLASVCGKLECMQILIEAKADVNTSTKREGSAVHYASNNGHTKCLQLLIDNHADVNARNSDGYTPAMGACGEKYHLPCLQLLVDNKADLKV
jgi:ankyrin repeat protein